MSVKQRAGLVSARLPQPSGFLYKGKGADQGYVAYQPETDSTQGMGGQDPLAVCLRGLEAACGAYHTQYRAGGQPWRLKTVSAKHRRTLPQDMGEEEADIPEEPKEEVQSERTRRTRGRGRKKELEREREAVSATPSSALPPIPLKGGATPIVKTETQGGDTPQQERLIPVPSEATSPSIKDTPKGTAKDTPKAKAADKDGKTPDKRGIVFPVSLKYSLSTDLLAIATTPLLSMDQHREIAISAEKAAREAEKARQEEAKRQGEASAAASSGSMSVSMEGLEGLSLVGQVDVLEGERRVKEEGESEGEEAEAEAHDIARGHWACDTVALTRSHPVQATPRPSVLPQGVRLKVKVGDMKEHGKAVHAEIAREEGLGMFTVLQQREAALFGRDRDGDFAGVDVGGDSLLEGVDTAGEAQADTKAKPVEKRPRSKPKPVVKVPRRVAFSPPEPVSPEADALALASRPSALMWRLEELLASQKRRKVQLDDILKYIDGLVKEGQPLLTGEMNVCDAVLSALNLMSSPPSPEATRAALKAVEGGVSPLAVGEALAGESNTITTGAGADTTAPTPATATDAKDKDKDKGKGTAPAETKGAASGGKGAAPKAKGGLRVRGVKPSVAASGDPCIATYEVADGERARVERTLYSGTVVARLPPPSQTLPPNPRFKDAVYLRGTARISQTALMPQQGGAVVASVRFPSLKGGQEAEREREREREREKEREKELLKAKALAAEAAAVAGTGDSPNTGFVSSFPPCPHSVVQLHPDGAVYELLSFGCDQAERDQWRKRLDEIGAYYEKVLVPAAVAEGELRRDLQHCESADVTAYLDKAKASSAILTKRLETVAQHKGRVVGTVVPPNAAEVAGLQAQERLRFRWLYSCPFPYVLEGKRSLAPALGPRFLSIRQTVALITDRPNSASVLNLVRDATARLPHGVGTRQDVVASIASGSYLARRVPMSKLSTMVSCALDRLSSPKTKFLTYVQGYRVWYAHTTPSMSHSGPMPVLPLSLVETAKIKRRVGRSTKKAVEAAASPAPARKRRPRPSPSKRASSAKGEGTGVGGVVRVRESQMTEEELEAHNKMVAESLDLSFSSPSPSPSPTAASPSPSPSPSVVVGLGASSLQESQSVPFIPDVTDLGTDQPIKLETGVGVDEYEGLEGVGGTEGGEPNTGDTTMT
ncbi:hypothetical protein KIPB_003538 [Kipferlia bialata]|uniref:Nuclear factor related to kappa-B-binding protein second winged helix domain-containing protein n=1 Tax=Kipferlia bialata TaxID=797122 RepID=A0A9K3GH52_9EUKA|nr:hypothetical protein KIPB_003538 [Kipferlia bialata]|eukprot:g3538.t1